MSAPSNFTFAQAANATYIDELWKQFSADPNSVDPSWQQFFAGMQFAQNFSTGGGDSTGSGDEARVEAMINAYRRLGHLSAHLDPLNAPRPLRPEMDPSTHGLEDIDPNRIFRPANLPQPEMTFGAIQTLLQNTYCRRIGADFRELDEIEIVVWLQKQMESCQNQPALDVNLRKRVMEKLAAAEGFERFLQTRYLGQKRFSCEGSDALIPMLDIIANDAASAGVEEICIGMAHRGRLNVLANFLGKAPEMILKEFEGSEFNPFDIDGDVKYHMGFASEVESFSKKPIRLYLSPNPSHLEAVNPVVEGFVRSRQFVLGDSNFKKVMPLLMHGDASFIGQGVVAETLNLSRLEKYGCGGTIHIIINNQIGFTTEPEESRSSIYASEIAKMVRAPVLHVNSDDPEAAVWSAQLAVAFRQTFHRDIVIDLIGYRRHGHNEGDEPAFTQPLMYANIAKHPTVFTTYSQRLVSEGVMKEAEIQAMSDQYRERMQAAYEKVHGKENPVVPVFVAPASLKKVFSYRKTTDKEVYAQVNTGVPEKTLRGLAERMTEVPSGFSPHKKVQRLLEQRREMVSGAGAVDWGLGELLAFASLAAEGRHVRLSGQDCGRGTFSSRHAVLRDTVNNSRLELLNQLDSRAGRVDVINSPLSEAGVLGFEFGYSVANPDALVLWEAQFGDFFNGAQIIIDQFLSASEAKWKQTCGLVMLLPHGHEGQGPEHSSGRPERFLQLCGNLNMQVVIPTTPAQHFHALRRQVNRDFRKPLIVMTPKSLLRHPECVSPLADFAKSQFQELIDDNTIGNPSSVERVIFCTGKLYYQLRAARDFQVPIVRVEQLYPFPYDGIEALFQKYSSLKQLIWVQEEPENMGAWNFVRGRLLKVLPNGIELRYVGRKNSGTPAEGSLKAHEAEQSRIVQTALSLARGFNIERAATGR